MGTKGPKSSVKLPKLQRLLTIERSSPSSIALRLSKLRVQPMLSQLQIWGKHLINQ